MSATAIDNYSVELNQGPPGNSQTYAPVRTNQKDGRVRFQMFTYTAASDASGKTVALLKLPKGARLLSIQLAVSATLGSATLAFGLAGANGNGFIDDGNIVYGAVAGINGADSIGAQVSDVKNCIATAATYTTANTKVELIMSTAQAYQAAPAAEGVLSIGTGAWLYMLAKDCYLTATVGTAALTTQILQGYCTYILD